MWLVPRDSLMFKLPGPFKVYEDEDLVKLVCTSADGVLYSSMLRGRA